MNTLFDRLVSHTLSPQQPAEELSGLSRDIENLLNHPLEPLRWTDDPILSGSILNYGLPSLVGRRIDAIMVEEIARDVVQALVRFESRLDPASIRVSASNYVDHPGVLSFGIESKLQGNNKRLHLQLYFDVHFGRANVLAHAHPSPVIGQP
jgi:predicted component of type VI protein secretion system